MIFRNGNKWMAVSIDTSDGFSAEKPVVLFEGPFINVPHYSYDVTPDGQRLLVLEAPEQESIVRQLHVITNWFRELKQIGKD